MKRQGRCKTAPIRQPEEDAEEEVELGEDETEEPPEGGQVQTHTWNARRISLHCICLFQQFLSYVC